MIVTECYIRRTNEIKVLTYVCTRYGPVVYLVHTCDFYQGIEFIVYDILMMCVLALICSFFSKFIARRSRKSIGFLKTDTPPFDQMLKSILGHY